MNKSLMAFAWVLSTMLVVRGLDYVTGDSFAASFRISEGAEMPLYWGWASLIAAALVMGSLVLKRARLLQNSALVCFAINAMFAAQAFAYRMLPVPWPPEDTRLVADHIGHSLLWLLIAVTLWWREGIVRRREAILRGEMV